MKNIESRVWYHGSPVVLEVLRAGSTVTPYREVAIVFSHRPGLVSAESLDNIRHDGVLPGYLYVIDEPVRHSDVIPHPRTSMEPDWEWLTTRPLRVRCVAHTVPDADSLLSDAEQHHMNG